MYKYIDIYILYIDLNVPKFFLSNMQKWKFKKLTNDIVCTSVNCLAVPYNIRHIIDM